jgi:hypothetical protein
MASKLDYVVNDVALSIPVSGGSLCHNKSDQIGRAFLAADLHSGAKHLIQPTITQSAALARANPTYAWWACHRLEQRTAISAAIEAGLIPLVPPRVMNGHGARILTGEAADIDAKLEQMALVYGPDRLLAAVKVEHDMKASAVAITAQAAE